MQAEYYIYFKNLIIRQNKQNNNIPILFDLLVEAHPHYTECVLMHYESKKGAKIMIRFVHLH